MANNTSFVSTVHFSITGVPRCPAIVTDIQKFVPQYLWEYYLCELIHKSPKPAHTFVEEGYFLPLAKKYTYSSAKIFSFF